MLAVLVAALPAARAADPDGQESPAVETTVEVRRVVWPVLVEPRAGADRDACTDMTPDDVVVTEAGLPVRVTAVAPGRPRTLHAIVIDVSGSMAGRLAEARSAAIDYVDALPRDEPAALWAFSDEVRLLAPPGTDRARLRRAIARLQPVHGTALWDALRFVLEMLAAWPDRKAILLVTDGADSTSLADDAESRAFAALRHEDPVTVFPLALDMSSRADRGPRAPLASLRRLAAETGGSLIDVPDAAHFRRALDDIRRRLDAEWTVTWTATARAPGTPRPVRIRARRGAPCRVRSAGPRLRVPSPPPLPPPRR
ncbi:MAG: VWA domain-containing protein, partial [Acidobacteria bacterium]